MIRFERLQVKSFLGVGLGRDLRELLLPGGDQVFGDVNVIVGRNGAGKTTCARALTAFFGPGNSFRGADLVASVAVGAARGEAQIASGSLLPLPEGLRLPRVFPEVRDRYLLSLHELLEMSREKDGDPIIAESIQRELQGGFDLATAFEALGWDQRPGGRRGTIVTAREALLEAEARAREALAAQDEIRSRERELDDINERLEGIARAEERAKRLEEALKRARLRSELEEKAEALRALEETCAPLLLAAFKETDLAAFDEHRNRWVDLGARLSELREERKDTARAREDLGLEKRPDDAFLAEKRRLVDAWRDAESAKESAAEAREELQPRIAAAEQALSENELEREERARRLPERVPEPAEIDRLRELAGELDRREAACSVREAELKKASQALEAEQRLLDRARRERDEAWRATGLGRPLALSRARELRQEAEALASREREIESLQSQLAGRRARQADAEKRARGALQLAAPLSDEAARRIAETGASPLQGALDTWARATSREEVASRLSELRDQAGIRVEDTDRLRDAVAQIDGWLAEPEAGPAGRPWSKGLAIAAALVGTAGAFLGLVPALAGWAWVAGLIALALLAAALAAGAMRPAPTAPGAQREQVLRARLRAAGAIDQPAGKLDRPGLCALREDLERRLRSAELWRELEKLRAFCAGEAQVARAEAERLLAAAWEGAGLPGTVAPERVPELLVALADYQLARAQVRELEEELRVREEALGKRQDALVAELREAGLAIGQAGADLAARLAELVEALELLARAEQAVAEAKRRADERDLAARQAGTDLEQARCDAAAALAEINRLLDDHAMAVQDAAQARTALRLLEPLVEQAQEVRGLEREIARQKAELEQLRQQERDLEQRQEKADIQARDAAALLNAALSASGLSPAQSGKEAGARLDELAKKIARARELDAALARLEQDRRDAERQREAEKAQISELAARLGMSFDGSEASLALCQEGLTRLGSAWPEHEELRRSIDKGRAVLEFGEKERGDAEGSEAEELEGSEAELAAALDRERALIAQRDGLLRQRADIEKAVADARRGAAVEEALDARARALAELRAARRAELEWKVSSSLGQWLQEQQETTASAALRRASALFQRFTHGFGTLQVREGQLLVRLDGQRVKHLRELSSATRIQLLMAARLGYVEAQEEAAGVEHPLPLLMDEVLANSDDARAEAIVDAAFEIAASGRQVFYFTAQNEEADRWAAAALRWSEREPERAVGFGLFALGAPPPPAQPIRLQALKPPPEPTPGETYEDYCNRLLASGEIAPFDPWASLESAPVWLVLRDVGALHACLRQSIRTVGQLRLLREARALGALGAALGEEEWGRVDRRARMVQALLRLWAEARGRRLTRDDFENMDIKRLGETRRTRLAELLEKVGGDPGAFLRAAEAEKSVGVQMLKNLAEGLQAWLPDADSPVAGATDRDQLHAHMLRLAADAGVDFQEDALEVVHASGVLEALACMGDGLGSPAPRR